MKYLRPSRALLAAVLAAVAIPAMAQTPAAPRDPYTQGARVGDKFDPYTQGTNATTRQDLAPESQPSTMPAQPGAMPMQPDVNMPGTMQQRMPDPYGNGAQWVSPNLGRPMGRPSYFLDGA